jgi:hypothetical protein
MGEALARLAPALGSLARPLSGKAAVAADILWRLKMTQSGTACRRRSRPAILILAKR